MKLRTVILILSSLLTHEVLGANPDVVRSDATNTIDNFGVCRKLTTGHGGGLSIFVPTSTLAEWNGFIASPPPGVALAACDCPLPWGGTITNGNNVTAYLNA